MHSLRDIFSEYRGLIMSGAVLTLLLSVYLIGWHWSIIAFASIYSVHDITGGFLILCMKYLAASALLSSVLCCLMIVVRRAAARKFIAGAALFLFFGSEFVRMFDWGALYYGGNHVDANFWAHAFYSDGTLYLTTWLSLGIYAAVALLFAALFLVIRNVYRQTERLHAGGLS